MSETFKMARSGRVYLLGSGQNKINPIHGADLADVCVSAASGDVNAYPVGGPYTYSHRDIAELAFAVLGKTPKITKIPIWTVNMALTFMRPFSSHYHTIGSFFAAVMQNDFNAPKTGQHSLKDYYEALVSH
jgi:nucleoside-diphosphate-sugar epimerase